MVLFLMVGSAPFVVLRQPWIVTLCNYSGACKAMYRALLEGVWISDIGRMAEVRNVPHLALQGVSIEGQGLS